MNARRAMQIGLSAVVVVTLAMIVWSGRGPSTDTSVASPALTTGGEGTVLVATYFHGDRRCETCMSIEQQSTSAIEQGFPVEIAQGRLVYRTVNTDRPENQHFTTEYGLTHSTLVLAEVENGETLRHVALDRVWELVWEEDAFREYVQSSVADWLAPKPSR